MPDGAAPARQETALSTSVFVEGLEVQALIGVLAHEQGQRQPLLLDVEMEVAPPSRDELGLAFDYRLVGELAEALSGRQTGLVEVYAERLARALLAHPLVRSVRIRLRKPRALDNGCAGTEIRLARAG